MNRFISFVLTLGAIIGLLIIFFVTNSNATIQFDNNKDIIDVVQLTNSYPSKIHPVITGTEPGFDEKTKKGEETVKLLAENLNPALVRTRDSWDEKTTARVWYELRKFIIIKE